MIAAPYVQFIDHLIYTAPTLEEGMDRIEHLLGVRPVPGGRHPNFGTHNSLLSIGEGTYLEVIAPDLELPNPPRGRWLAEFFKGKPRLATWVRKATDIQAMRDVAISHDIHLGEIEQGERISICTFKAVDLVSTGIDLRQLFSLFCPGTR